MHKGVVSGCSLDVAKNSDLYSEPSISSSDRFLKWECFINLYCWVPWDLFLKQICFPLVEVDEQGGWILSLQAAQVLGADWLCCLWSQTESRSWCKVCFLNHHPLSEGIDSLNTISVMETNWTPLLCYYELLMSSVKPSKRVLPVYDSAKAARWSCMWEWSPV